MIFHASSGRRANRRRFPLVRSLALGLLLLSIMPATARTTRVAPPATRFACEGGVAFNVAYVRGGAWVTTSGGRWFLPQARSSIGRRYTSPIATFILDQDRAALVGLPGGPFQRCIAGGRSRAQPRAGRQA